MDLQIFPFSFISIFLLISFIVIFIKGWKKSRIFNQKTKLPQGLWKLPIIGSIHHLIEGGSVPHQVLRNLSKKHGPLMHLMFGEVLVIVILSPRLAKEVLKTHELAFLSRPDIVALRLISYNYSGIGFSPYGDYYCQMRKIPVLQLLSNKRVKWSH